MEGKITFNAFEKELMHEMRNMMHNSEDRVDLENQCSNIMMTLLKRVLENRNIPFEIDADDISFDPAAAGYYSISRRLDRMKAFRNLRDQSDLASVLGRFAGMAHNKYLHLSKHPEKARFKIRN